MLGWQLPIQHQHGIELYKAGGIWPLYRCLNSAQGPSVTMCLQYALKIDKEKVDKSRGKSVLQQELQVMPGRHSMCTGTATQVSS